MDAFTPGRSLAYLERLNKTPAVPSSKPAKGLSALVSMNHDPSSFCDATRYSTRSVKMS